MQHRPRPGFRALLLAATVVMVLTACGSDTDSAGGSDDARDTPLAFRDGLDPVSQGNPARGGELTYALEAESPSGFNVSDWFCAPSCRMVAKAVFDPLTVVNVDGEVEPFLAASVESDADATEWTIEARPGVSFHDGTPFDAAAIKANLEAQRASRINGGSFALIEGVDVVDPLTVSVHMTAPWSAFDVWLATPLGYMMAPSMLASEDGAQHPVGTGPFVFAEWSLDDHLTVERNPDYWQEGVPFLDRVTFVPIPDSDARLSALRAGDVDVIHTDQADQIARLRDTDGVRVIESELFGETNYYQFNVERPPFDNVEVRRALAMAIDVERIHTERNSSISRIANGPFPPSTPGYLENTGYPEFNPTEARDLIANYEASHGEISFALMTTTSPALLRTAQLVQQMWEDAGVDVEIEQVEFTEFLERDIAGDYDVDDARLFGGADPDLQSRWWHSSEESTVGNIADAEVDASLDTIRSSPDADERRDAAEAINRRLAEQAYYAWTSWTVWAVAASDDIVGFNLTVPDEGGEIGVVLGDHWLTYVSRKP